MHMRDHRLARLHKRVEFRLVIGRKARESESSSDQGKRSEKSEQKAAHNDLL
jgi:hypothetical protein